MERNYGFNEILKHINELSMKMDVNDVLSKAEAISLQMMKCKVADLPQAVCEVLGLKSNSVPTTVGGFSEENVAKKTHHKSPPQNVSVPVLAANGTQRNSLPKSIHTLSA
ncbi:TBC1 domain family member 15 [Pelobates cultripes]|uniref:TBC1 domain family member 15 n=1 Tax=Pelobates cultripes TaxID=61616 RepID=A0AAD1R6V8_PELCU|nr:TBC1 domain family member 15 [Pelobates cultripes]